MVQLHRDREKFRTAGLQIVGISYDPVATLKAFAEAQEIEFPLLSDPGSKTIDAYTLRNTQVREGSRQDGIPYPATLVVDPDGVVRVNLPGTTRVRHTTEALVEAVAGIEKKSPARADKPETPDKPDKPQGNEANGAE